MKTYIIQFWRDGNWHNVTDEYENNIEFICCAGAREIAKNLIYSPKYPELIQDYRIQDSEGWCQNIS